jgi:hypothetical protein
MFKYKKEKKNKCDNDSINDCAHDCYVDLLNPKNIITPYQLRNVLIKDPKSIDPNGNFSIKPNTFSTYIKNVNIVNRVPQWLPFITNGVTNLSSINVMKYGPDGNLYIGGGFLSTGIETIYCIVRWDGKDFKKLGNGVNGAVNAIEFDATGNLYIGGSFLYSIPKSGQPIQLLNNIGKYNKLTDSWEQLQCNGQIGVGNTVNALKYSSSTNRLYIGGSTGSTGSTAVTSSRGIFWGSVSSLCYLDLTLSVPIIKNVEYNLVINGIPSIQIIKGTVRYLEFDIVDQSKLYVGGKITYTTANGGTYLNVFLGLINNTELITFPIFYTLTAAQIAAQISGEAYTLLSVNGSVPDTSLLYIGGNCEYIPTPPVTATTQKDTLRNLILFDPVTNSFSPISTITITTPPTTSVLFPNGIVRTIAIDSVGTLYIGGDFTAISYINSTLNNITIPVTGAGRYAEFKNNTWSSDLNVNGNVNTIIFKNKSIKTKQDILIGCDSSFGNVYTTGLVTFTNDYINLIVDNKVLITLTKNGSSATISSNEVCGKTSGFLYSNSAYESFNN